MKIISYNVNGIRAAANKGLYQWIEKESPDVLCLQEIKATEDQIDVITLRSLGYNYYFHPAEKKRLQWCRYFVETGTRSCKDRYGNP